MGHAPKTEVPPPGGKGTFQVWSPGVGSRRFGISGGTAATGRGNGGGTTGRDGGRGADTGGAIGPVE
jgi:hypothetical protein